MTNPRGPEIRLTPDYYECFRMENDGTLVLELSPEAKQYLQSNGFTVETDSPDTVTNRGESA